MDTIYLEKAIINHPRVERILAHYGKKATVIECEHYGEVFNPKSQNFRIQKQNPKLILANKIGKKVLETPEGFGIGGQQNFYFSHMLNCLYDCRYCYLQGMYPSANQVIFVNYEEFMDDIQETVRASTQPSYFFSGYDCDSLAFEPVTHFLKSFLPFFAQTPKAILELRTKSTNIRSLLEYTPFDNCITAFSFTPSETSTAVEHKVPPVQKRIQAMATLAKHGWKLGLRFDPLIYTDDFLKNYTQLIKEIFEQIPANAIHSVSVGPLRFPTKMYQKLTKLYPKDELLSQPLIKRGKTVSYSSETEDTMKTQVLSLLHKHLDKTLIFECQN